MLLMVYVHAVHVRSGFGMIDTIVSILQKQIDWKQRSIIVAIRLRHDR